MGKTAEERFWAKVEKKGPNDCWLWKGSRAKNGYGVTSYKGITTTAHRIAWEIANGESVPDGMYVLHSCDNPPCVNPAHLRPGTPKENSADMYARGRDNPVCGAKNHLAKLSPEIALEIVVLVKRGLPIGKVALKFGVSSAAVSDVLYGRRWSDATGITSDNPVIPGEYKTTEPIYDPAIMTRADRRNLVIRLHGEGYTFAEIGRMCGVGKHTPVRWMEPEQPKKPRALPGTKGKNPTDTGSGSNTSPVAPVYDDVNVRLERAAKMIGLC